MHRAVCTMIIHTPSGHRALSSRHRMKYGESRRSLKSLNTCLLLDQNREFHQKYRSGPNSNSDWLIDWRSKFVVSLLSRWFAIQYASSHLQTKHHRITHDTILMVQSISTHARKWYNWNNTERDYLGFSIYEFVTRFVVDESITPTELGVQHFTFSSESVSQSCARRLQISSFMLTDGLWQSDFI